MIANIPCTIQIILTSVILAILFIVEEKFRNISEKIQVYLRLIL